MPLERIDPNAPLDDQPVTFCDKCHKLSRAQQVTLPKLRKGWYCLKCQQAARNIGVSDAAA